MSSSDIVTLNEKPENEKTGTVQHSTAERVLFILKTRDAQTISALAKHTGTSAENIRQQLQKSMSEGLVEAYATESKGKAGRPTQLWKLTEKGNNQFPDRHAELTVTLMRHINSLGAGLTERIIGLREQEILDNYHAAMTTICPNGRLKATARGC